MSALVSLVGAGPGHPDYLTVKGLRCLQAADIVFHDALVTPEVLALASRAECVDVGKRGGRASTPQDAIESAMIAAARRGLRVVRLKGGDSFVFGRGSEEALALAAADVPFEIVPGVSSAIAAPALGGIPVTHRGVASAVLVVNGSDPAAFRRAASGLAPGAATLVVMMGLATRDATVDALLDAGWSVTTPSAIVVGASTAGEFTWRGPLSDLPSAEIPRSSSDLPGTVIIGHVTALPLRLANGSPALVEVLS
jgi:uroporphyrin-III C-methyltransferase